LQRLVINGDACAAGSAAHIESVVAAGTTKRVLTAPACSHQPTGDRSHEEAGCIEYEVALDTTDPAVLVLHEMWKDEAALEQHCSEDFFLRLSINGVRQFAKERIGRRCRIV